MRLTKWGGNFSGKWDVGVGQLIEKRQITIWRWFLKSEKVQGRGRGQIGTEELELGLLSVYD